MSKSPTYRDAGVDIDAGNRLVDLIRPIAQTTRRAGSIDHIGGFSGLFDLDAAGFEDPVIVAATDGVGTKLRIAIETNRLGTVGIDLVAMCVNDLICQGATPLFFLDYLAMARIDVDAGARIVEGLRKGAGSPAARSSAANPRKCPASIPAGTSTSPGLPSVRSNAINFFRATSR